MKIEMISLDKLIPYENNPRKNAKAVKAVAESIKQFGFKVPIIVDKDLVIVAGHTRALAARKLGLTEVPCIIADDLNKDQVKAFRLVDNKVAEIAEWDIEALIQELNEIEMDLSLFGFEKQKGINDVVEDEFEIELPKKPNAKRGDIYKLGNHRLICGDATDINVIEKLMDMDMADCLITDPPYNIDYDGGVNAKEKRRILNDNMASDEFGDFLTKAFKAAAYALKPGGAFYVYHADKETINFRTALEINGLEVKQTLIWNKNVFTLGRQDYQWKHEPCQKPGTKVVMEGGFEKNIEDIVAGDRLVGLHKPNMQLVGWNKTQTGKLVKGVASRDYDGNIYNIIVGDKKTNATDNHKFTVRYNAKEASKYYVYLMKKGTWWRVGISQLRNSRGSGMRDRLRAENGDVMWIVSKGFDSKIEAQIEEAIISCSYGIPQTVWNTDKIGRKVSKNDDQISRIYEGIGIEKINEGAKRLLGDRINYPQIKRHEGKESTRAGFTVTACNLMPKVYEVLMPEKDINQTTVARYKQIDEITVERYKGKVYSLSVEGEHYISDGIVTHNCLYGWKRGGSHYFIDDRTWATVIEEPFDVDKLKASEAKELLKQILAETQTSVIDVDKPQRSEEHPTMKPIKLIARNMLNSTRKGEAVLDPFGGSGTTLIVAEQLERRCYMVELDEKYVDVIIKRWEDFTGLTAEKLN